MQEEQQVKHLWLCQCLSYNSPWWHLVENIFRDEDIITCVNEINNWRPQDLNLLFPNKTSGREEASWWETFESQDVSSIMSFSLTHTVTEDSHCLTDFEDTHCLSEWGHTLSHCLWGSTLSLRTHTDSEDTHCGGNLWHHYSIQTHGPIFRKLTECIWCCGDRMCLERLRCTGWVRDQLNQSDVDLNFPYPSL